jgi:DNA-binding transcriptional LysR family regulator
VTPTQLRAYAAVVRFGSVKRAAADLAVSEAAVSLHMGQLRKELGDQLFTRTGNGLAFTPGGLRLAGRAVELLGLQERTILEVREAAARRSLLRVAASSLFAEHAAPGLIELFAAADRNGEVELSVRSTDEFIGLLQSRTVDIAIGTLPPNIDPSIVGRPFLNYQLIAVASPDHPVTRIAANLSRLRQQTWLLGPSMADRVELAPNMLRRMGVPDGQQQIFQSHAAALEEAKRNRGIALAVSFAVSQDLANGDLKRLAGPALQAEGVWNSFALAERNGPSPADDLARFMTTPPAIQAMLRGAGVTAGRFQPGSHITLWS